MSSYDTLQKWCARYGYMYMSSQTYYNWFEKNSNLDNLPVMGNSKNWYQFEAINIPIISFTLYSNIVRVIGYVIRYSVGSINCKLVAIKCLIFPFLIV